MIVISLGVLGLYCFRPAGSGVSLLGGDGSDMAFLASECKTVRITSMSGDTLLDSISTVVSCGIAYSFM